MDAKRVQAIATMSKSTDTIPAEYIRPENEQPAISTYHGPKLEVPVIDFSEKDEAKFIDKIVEASKEWGLFQIVNHEIPNEVIKKLQDVGKEFFELPQEEKEKIAKTEGSKSIEGYGTKLQKDVAGKKGWVDHLFYCNIAEDQNQITASCKIREESEKDPRLTITIRLHMESHHYRINNPFIIGSFHLIILTM